jgi:hypothetical protein
VGEWSRLLREVAAGDGHVVRCSWSGAVRVGEKWVETRDRPASGIIELFLLAVDGLFSHGICANCLARELERTLAR